ncbi:MAG TPA: ATP-binding cassette domain-containing protein [Acidobacteriaceae bacterium]|jgi:ABC-type sulfate/molybdate transport systems ATPase subunit|nr:ATP-binding cassette domain-containing protein [Acidobacteriaceae bacterium]
MPDIQLHHHQGSFQLHADFSLTTPWTVLFGPSGAGKSTLLRILAGLTPPSNGRIHLNGSTLLDTTARTAVPAGHRSIGFVTQQPALFPHLTAADNVAFGIRSLPREQRAARIDEMLDFFGAAPLAHRPAAQLSGGERQRVALARALAPAPQLLLLDEPLAALDDASAHDIRTRLLDHLPQSNTRVVYVSHDLAEIWPIPATVVLLENGRVTASGPLREVLAPHRNRLLEQLR